MRRYWQGLGVSEPCCDGRACDEIAAERRSATESLSVSMRVVRLYNYEREVWPHKPV